MSAKASRLSSKFDARLQGVQQAVSDIQQTRNRTEYLHVDQLRPSRMQQRRDFSGVPRLGQSVLERGVLQSLRVRAVPGEEGYEIIAGEERWRASVWAATINPDRALIPCIVTTATDEAAYQDGLHENTVRSNLNAYELTKAVLARMGQHSPLPEDDLRRRLAREGNRPGADDEIAQLYSSALNFIGLDLKLSSFSRFYLPLLSLPEDLLFAMETQELAFTLALELRRIKDADLRQAALQQVLAGQMSLDVLRTQYKSVPAQSQNALSHQWAKVGRRMSSKRLSALSESTQAEVAQLLTQLEKLLKTK